MEKEYTMYRELTKKPYVAPSLTVVDFRVEQGFQTSGSLGLQADEQALLGDINIESRTNSNAFWASSEASDGWIY